MHRLTRATLSFAALLGIARVATAQAGLTSNIATATLSAAKTASLSVSITSGATQTIANLVDNTVNTFPAATPVVIQTDWDINPSAASISLVGYFSAPSQALANGTDYLPSSLVLGRVSTGLPTSFTAFTQNALAGVGTAGGSLVLFTQAINGANKQSSRTDNLELQIDMTGQAATAGTYTGTLNLRLVTQ